MGSHDPLPVVEAMEYRVGAPRGIFSRIAGPGYRRNELIVVLFAAAIFLVSVISPPALMDDVDSVQAQIARNMLQSGDWVTPPRDGVAYLAKSPLQSWALA